jgi:hypothetical protein
MAKKITDNIIRQVEDLNGELIKRFHGIETHGKKATQELAEAIKIRSQQLAPVRVTKYAITRDEGKTKRYGSGWANSRTYDYTREEASIEARTGGKKELKGGGKVNRYKMARGFDLADKRRSVLAEVVGGTLRNSARVVESTDKKGKTGFRVYYDTRELTGDSYNYAIVQHERHDFKHAVGTSGFLRKAYWELKDAGVRKIKSIIAGTWKKGGR